MKPPPSLSSGRTEFRLYFINAGGHFSGSFEFRADTDDAAIKIAEAWRDGRGAELWSRNRKIKTWKGP